MGFFGGKKQGGSSSEKLRPSNVGAREFPRDNVMYHHAPSISALLLSYCFFFAIIIAPHLLRASHCSEHCYFRAYFLCHNQGTNGPLP